MIASLAVHSGEVIASTMKSNDAVNFLSFLKKLDLTYSQKTLHIIVDKLAGYKNKEVKEWLKNKRKIKLHFTPTYLSWLNQVEIWFNILTRDVVKCDIWQSSEQLSAQQLLDYVDTYDKKGVNRFEWTCTGKPFKV